MAEADDDVHPLSLQSCHLFGNRLELILDDEGARVRHLDEGGHYGDGEKGVFWKMVLAFFFDTSRVSGVR